METVMETVLVVDDSAVNIDILSNILKDEYKVRVAKSGEAALKSVLHTKPDIILLDVVMPEMDGFEVCKIIKSNPKTSNIPIIFVTAKDETKDEISGFEIGAADYITKPISPAIVKTRVRTQLALYDQQRELEKQVLKRTKELNDSRLEIIRKLVVAAEYKDTDTGLHIVRMSTYSYFIAKAYGFEEKELEIILNAAPMHDIGKIGIPDRILQKPGKLNEKEWEIMKTHSYIGAKIIGEQSSDLLIAARVIAHQHHEKWNGNGYPQRLKSENINIYARIVAIADVFDALTSKRPYKEPWDVEDALKLIHEEKNKHFDPDVVEAMQKVLPDILETKEKYG